MFTFTHPSIKPRILLQCLLVQSHWIWQYFLTWMCKRAVDWKTPKASLDDTDDVDWSVAIATLTPESGKTWSFML